MTDDARPSGSALYLSGTVASAVPSGGGIEGKGSTYTIEGEDGRQYLCDYTDIVTDGFRTLIAGDVVRFMPSDDGFDARATHVLKLNEPSVDDFYSESAEGPAGSGILGD